MTDRALIRTALMFYGSVVDNELTFPNLSKDKKKELLFLKKQIRRVLKKL
ncbi:MAG: hypothetical protein KGI50_06605 [Patescibacteria group bacterium]|nr:hypothetical protein [Patescibacteria group bacterium]MDE2439117.1 hypothetical protein [Patescibacteria group bacterium]